MSKPRNLLDRLLEAPGLAAAIPQLPAQSLHRVIQHCGLEDCGEILAFATPEQLQGVLDLDLWRGGVSGVGERFDADRFAVWLEVLLDCGTNVAALQLEKMDIDLVIAGIAQHARVFDRAALLVDHASGVEIGGYVVIPRHSRSWNAVLDTLTALAADHPEYFHQVMRGCRRLSNAGYEIDGLHDVLTDQDQAMYDLAAAREARRERQGFMSAAQARAFLEMTRREAAPGAAPFAAAPAIFHAYVRDLEEPAAPVEAGTPPVETADIGDVLVEMGVAPPPRALLGGVSAGGVRLAHLQTQLRFAHERDEAAYALRLQELGFLANTLAAGCPIQGRALTPGEATEAAAAVCNLALENGLPDSDRFLCDHDLVGVFHHGWRFLYQNVAMHAAQQVIAVLKELRCSDREIQAGLDHLRFELSRHRRDGAPWRARDALEVIALLDTPAWAALAALIAECPVLHAAIAASRDPRARTIDAARFEFIAESRQIAAVHDFLEGLPAALGG